MAVQDESASVNLERQFTEIVEQYSDLAYSIAFRMLRGARSLHLGLQGPAQLQRPV